MRRWVGLLIALGVNAALPDLRPEPKKEAPHMQVEVKNSTKKLCVIGEPVLHSKSPLIQNTMLAALGLEGPAIGAAQRRLAAHILSHPEDNTPARRAGPGPGGAERAVGAAIFAWTGKNAVLPA